MQNKYCKNKHPNEIVWKIGAGSQVWKKLLQARDLVEYQIFWRIRKGNSNIWFDNWTKEGDFYTLLQNSREWDTQYQQVQDLIDNGAWNTQVMSQLFPQEVADHIKEFIRISNDRERKDCPMWMLDPTGRFTVKSAWDFIRQRGEKCSL